MNHYSSHEYLNGIAEVSSSGHRHHGKQTSARANVQNHHPFPSCLHSAHRCTNTLIVFFILKSKYHENQKMSSLYVYEGYEVMIHFREYILWPNTPCQTLFALNKFHVLLKCKFVEILITIFPSTQNNMGKYSDCNLISFCLCSTEVKHIPIGWYKGKYIVNRDNLYTFNPTNNFRLL